MDPAQSQRFATWLQEVAGIDEPRRVVRADASSILVSKFEEGFSARLLAAVDDLRDLFDPATVAARYEETGAGSPGIARVDCWGAAVRSLLVEATTAGRITREQRAEVEAGVDSVAALMASILWTSPVFGDEAVPKTGEIAAYREALEAMNAENSLFTRYYGEFEGLRVVNHCPGARVARRLLEQAWRISTGTEPPAVEAPG